MSAEIRPILERLARGSVSVGEAERQIHAAIARDAQVSGNPVFRIPIFWRFFFFVMGSVCLAIGLWHAAVSTRFAISGKPTRGVVDELVSTGAESGPAPVIRYEVEGRTYRFQGPPGYGYQPRQTLDVVYLPGIPSVAGIDAFGPRWSVPLMCIPLGSIFVGIASFAHKYASVDS